jgi:hypothetical protein
VADVSPDELEQFAVDPDLVTLEPILDPVAAE